MPSSPLLSDPSPSPAIELRAFSHAADYEAAVELQRRTWGADFSDVTPASILKISQKVGGISAGAFGGDGSLLAFLYGLTGFRDGQPIHWSHMMAVAPHARDLGLGTKLKLYQRDVLLPMGVERVEWTFDPLEARNAHLNLNHLGAEIGEYVEDMYEGETGSDLWAGLGTDRLILVWRIASERVADAIAGRREGSAEPFHDAPVLNEANRRGTGEPEKLGAPRVRIEIPANVQALKETDIAVAAAWRASSRWAFEAALARGYQVEAFQRDREAGRCFYCLQIESGKDRPCSASNASS
jgi:predicted GNAT superfamily acetyltransferase